MELYTILLHFPDTYGSLENKSLTLSTTDYFDNSRDAVKWALTIANAMVTPKPDFFYIECPGDYVLTDNVEATKKAIHNDSRMSKPTVIEIEQ